jgi:hypothetical protein
MKNISLQSILLGLGTKYLRLCTAWIVGCVIYFFLAIGLCYDGFISMICQPFMAMIVSAVVTILSLILGLPLMLPTPHRPLWLAVAAAGICLITGILFFCLPGPFVPLFRWIPATIQNNIDSPEFLPIYAGYIIIIFTIVNWPKIVDWSKVFKLNADKSKT